jgi:hypothetical protein
MSRLSIHFPQAGALVLAIAAAAFAYGFHGGQLTTSSPEPAAGVAAPVAGARQFAAAPRPRRSRRTEVGQEKGGRPQRAAGRPAVPAAAEVAQAAAFSVAAPDQLNGPSVQPVSAPTRVAPQIDGLPRGEDGPSPRTERHRGGRPGSDRHRSGADRRRPGLENDRVLDRELNRLIGDRPIRGPERRVSEEEVPTDEPWDPIDRPGAPTPQPPAAPPSSPGAPVAPPSPAASPPTTEAPASPAPAPPTDGSGPAQGGAPPAPAEPAPVPAPAPVQLAPAPTEPASGAQRG